MKKSKNKTRGSISLLADQWMINHGTAPAFRRELYGFARFVEFHLVAERQQSITDLDKIKILALGAVGFGGRRSIETPMSFIEEQLTPAESKMIREFLTWAFFDWDERMFGHGNFDDRWAEWRATRE